MELAIPLIALGGMYVVSNQSNNTNKKIHQEQQKENYTNMGIRTNLQSSNLESRFNNYLPNTNIPPENYPITNKKELVDTVSEYINPNSATDKYFNQNAYENKERSGKKVDSNMQNIYSLTGNYLSSADFKHNNMVPFTSPKFQGLTYNVNNAETILDNMAGTGSQVIKKIEQAPLFKPQENVQWTYGAPDMSDFYQSRMNASIKNNMVKPFESVRVGPGLNKGYSSEGTGGFNSGMESRDQWLPKTVDELRIATNPKEEFSLINHEGPADAAIKNVGILGKVEKYSPDTFYINTQDRWLTTTGAEKANRMIAEEIVKTSHRNDTTTHYQGVASSNLKTASYTPKIYSDPKRVELECTDVPHSTAVGRGPITDGENYLRSHTNYENNRSNNLQPDTMRSGFSKAIGAVIAPIMDILKPSKKEEYASNMRVYGNMGTNVPENYVLNRGDVPITTVKETTLYTPNSYIGNQKDGAYTVSKQQAISNQRDTTNCSTLGTAGSKYGTRSYDSDYRQTNNESKEKLVVARTNQGNTNMFNPYINVSYSKLDSDRDNNRLWAPSAVIPGGPTVQTHGKMQMPQYYDNCIGCDRINPDLLEQFRQNPYTHSLTYAV